MESICKSMFESMIEFANKMRDEVGAKSADDVSDIVRYLGVLNVEEIDGEVIRTINADEVTIMNFEFAFTRKMIAFLRDPLNGVDYRGTMIVTVATLWGKLMRAIGILHSLGDLSCAPPETFIVAKREGKLFWMRVTDDEASRALCAMSKQALPIHKEDRVCGSDIASRIVIPETNYKYN